MSDYYSKSITQTKDKLAMLNIIANLTDKGVGISILGSKEQLKLLHDSIVKIVNGDKESHDPDRTFLLELVTALYHAIETPQIIDGKAQYKMNVVLPVLLIQIHILNKYIKQFQGEDNTCIEISQDFIQMVLLAIADKSVSIKDFVNDWLANKAPLSNQYIFPMAKHYCAQYIAYHPDESRLDYLKEVMIQIDESQFKHRAIQQSINEQAMMMNIDPQKMKFKEDDKIFELLKEGKIDW